MKQSLVSTAIESRPLLLLGLVSPHQSRTPLFPQAVALSSDLHDMCVMQKPVQHRRYQRIITTKHVAPLIEREVRSDDDRAGFIALSDHLEEQVGLIAAHGQVADLIDNEQAWPGLKSV